MDYNLDKFKPGTIQWLNEANRIARQNIGRDLTKDEIRKLYNADLASRQASKPGALSTQYSGKPGNIKSNSTAQLNRQTYNPKKVPARVNSNVPTNYTPPTSNTRGFTMVGEGQMSGVGSIPRATQIQKGVSGYLPVFNKPVGTPMSGVGSIGYPYTAPNKMGNILDVTKAGWGRAKLPGTATNFVYANPMNVAKGATTATKLAGVAGKASKAYGGLSALSSVIPFYNMTNPNATIKDKVLDFATGTSFLTGLGNYVPPTLMLGPVPAGLIAQGVGKVGPLVGTGMSFIPRDYNKVKPQQQVPVEQPQAQPKQKAKVNVPEIADDVAIAVNRTTGTNIPVSNNYMPSGLNNTQQMIVRIAREEGVDPALALAIAGAESGFNPNAKSPAGAIGLMQLMPGTAKGLGVDPNDPEQNVRGGLRYLRTQMKNFDNSLNLALSAYNAGPGAVQKYGGIPPYKETRNYINTIASKKKYWDNIFSNGQQVAYSPSTTNVPRQIQPTGIYNYAIPQTNATPAYDKLFELYNQMNNNGGLDVSVNGASLMGNYNPMDYITPRELELYGNLQRLNTSIDPETILDLINQSDAQRLKYDRLNAMINPSMKFRDMEQPTTNLEKLNTVYDFVNKQNEKELALYENMLDRADNLAMARRFGLPYGAVKSNMNGVLQYIANPVINQKFKEQNRIPDALIEMIKEQNKGDITRANAINQGNIDMTKTNNEYNNFKVPMIRETLDSLELRNQNDNATRGVGYYTQAKIADANNKRMEILMEMGLPAKIAGSLATAMQMVDPGTNEYDQIIQYIMGLTGATPQDLNALVNPTVNSSYNYLDSYGI